MSERAYAAWSAMVDFHERRNAESQEQIAALTAERDRLAAALREQCRYTDEVKGERDKWINAIRCRDKILIDSETSLLRQTLEALEWHHDRDEGGYYCRQCTREKSTGHAPDCIVGLALKGLR